SSAKARPCKQRFLRERRGHRQARCIQHTKLFAFLLAIEVPRHCRLVVLFEQVIIEFERALITSCQLFELLFDRRSRLDPALQNADLTLNLPLPLYQVGNAQIILAYSRTQLLNRWRLNSSGLRIRGGATAFWRFAHSPF